MFQCLDDAHIRILKISVFADKRDLDLIEESFLTFRHRLPSLVERFATFDHCLWNGKGVEAQTFREKLDKTLGLEEEGDVID